MQPSYHGAPPSKEKKSSLFISSRTTAKPVSTRAVAPQPQRASEMSPLLEAALRNARSTEHIADATLDVLERQGESIDSSTEHVRGVAAASSQAQGVIQRMHSQLLSKRACLYTAMGGLFVLNVAVVVIMLGNHGRLYKD